MYFLYFTICTIGGSQEERLLVEVWALLPWSNWFSTIPECHDGVVYDTSLRDLGIQFSQYLEKMHTRSFYCRLSVFFFMYGILFFYSKNAICIWVKYNATVAKAVSFYLSGREESGLLRIIKKSRFYYERFEPRSHFKSRLSLIVLVNVVLNRTVTVDSEWRLGNLCGSHLQSQSELYHVRRWY